MSVPFKVVIPARYGSTRLHGKPLLLIAGKPMIAHVCARAKEANAEEIVVATDDERILNTVLELGFQAVLTRANHESGTERIAEVAEKFGWSDDTIIVNLQGDEPLLPADYIRQVAQALANQNHAGMATLAAKIQDVDEIFNPNAVKVVLDKNSYALYFSRAPIPWHRAEFKIPPTPLQKGGLFSPPLKMGELYFRHIGLYAYTAGFLKKYCAWDASPLEQIEALEQLRILWHGEKILVQIVGKSPPAGVDTLEDLHRVEAFLKN
ncbi:MAG: 3-deoxy-manno-octulosonate cytidylyltransferase [Methylococcales bacterium]|nr:3-deoxy-manno-octulosonate cytidylyltransferase [Methylococcales bacterium]